MVGQSDSLFTDVLSDDARKSFSQQRHWTTELHYLSLDDSLGWRWLDRKRLDQYVFCFYWTLGVMRTMPSEVQPVNKVERLYVMVFMFFAFSAFAICVALITQTFFKFSERKRMFDEDMASVRSYMRQINASENVQSSVKDFLRHLFERRKILSKEQSMLRNLPTSLHNMLKHARLAEYLKDLKVMQDLPDRAIVYLSDICEIKDLAPGTCVCKKARTCEACFVIMSGRLSHRDGHEGLGHLRGQEERLFQGKIVDEECLLHALPLMSNDTLVAAVCVEVIRIERTSFFEIVMTHPDLQRTYTSCRPLEPDVMYGATSGEKHKSRQLSPEAHDEASMTAGIASVFSG
jgi:CRP-like cAMP-binding protein